MGDATGLVTGEKDVAMMDIGDVRRPPGDPPDAPRVWVEKVTGKASGGRLHPELILDDGFVESKIRLEFPNGEDGEPVVTIEQEVLDVMHGLWKQCVIVKVLGRKVAIAALSKKLRELWSPKEGMYVMDLPRGFFMVRFDNEEEYVKALSGGPWRIFGSYLMVQAWTPDFDPLVDDIVTTPVWIRLSNIPVGFYHRAILMSIAKGLGRPVKVDMTTLNFERGRFARICVEINLRRPLKGTIMVNGGRYYVSYEGLPNICSACGLMGHTVHGCPRKIVETAVEVPAQKEGRVVETPAPVSDGFTEVRRRGGRSESSRKVTAFVAGGSQGNLERNIQEIRPSTELPKILVSNQFGMLEEDCNLAGIEKDAQNLEGDKEITSFSLGTGKGMSVTKARGGNSVGPADKGKGPFRETFNEKSQTKLQNRGGMRLKLKQQPIRPNRGIVFGPARGETEMSLSGKRMRVENEAVGRRGGTFVASSAGRAEQQQLIPQSETHPEDLMKNQTENLEPLVLLEQRDPPDGEAEMTVT